MKKFFAFLAYVLRVNYGKSLWIVKGLGHNGYLLFTVR